MGKHHDVAFPGESNEYRQARDELLAAELELDERIQKLRGADWFPKLTY